MSGFSSPSPSTSPRQRSNSHSRSRSSSPSLPTTKLLDSIPEDATPSPLPSPTPPAYTDDDSSARAVLIRSHLARVVQLVNETSRSVPPPQHHTHTHTRQVYQNIQYQYDPEYHGGGAAEFHQAARRRQHAQLAGLLLFGVFLLSCAGMIVAFVAAAVRAGRRSAHDFEMRRQCFLTHGRAPHCEGSVYNRW